MQKRSGALRGAAAAVVALLSVTASPQPTDLDRVRAEIRQLRQQLEAVRQQAQTTERELEGVELVLEIRTRELDVARQAGADLEQQLAGTATEIEALRGRLEAQKNDLRTRLVALYRLGSLSYLRILLSLENEGNPLEAMSMLSYVASRDARLIREFQSSQEQLALRQSELEEQRERLQKIAAVIEENRMAIGASRAEKQRLLAQLRSDERGAARRLADLEEKARRLQRLIETLSLQKQGIDPAIDVRTLQGALPWPLRGRIIESFGRQRNPTFATWTINNGVKIESSPGTEVRSVFQGTVLYSQWFKGYGNLIILDHGNRVFSLYGNLRSSLVAVGDPVAAGQTIAGVGENEEGSAGYLYFEIRQDNRPEDPRKWLR